MSDASGSAAAVLACSRCDGPVNQDDLTEGLAVRIDGQPVCAMCIETLPPALKLQINRVRALKGLAVVTFRVALSGHPSSNCFTFTSAGLLLLHRRALVHGTDFTTPDLPPDYHAGTSITPPATPAPPPPPATGSKLTAVLLIGAAAVLVIGGIAAVAFSGATPSSPPPPAHAAPQPAAEPPHVTTTQVPPPSSSPILLPPSQPTPAPVRELKDYRSQYPDEIAALQAGLADDAAPELITALERDVLARGRNNVDKLRRVLTQTSLSVHELDEIDDALAKAEPPPRATFVDLRQDLANLNELSKRKRQMIMMAPVVAQPPAVVQPPVAPTPVAPVPQPVPEVKPPSTRPEAATMEDPGVPALFTPTAPAGALKISLWTGEVGPKPAAFVDLADPATRVPSPWPFFPGEAPPRFAHAVRLRGTTKDGFGLQLSIPREQIVGGGIYLTIHPRVWSRKELVISRVDAPATAKTFTFPNGENWQSFAFPVGDTLSDPVVIQLSDVPDNNPTTPFCLGSVAVVANGDPQVAASELSPSPLLTPNPLLKWDTLLRALKTAARGRKQEARWFDPKVLDTNAIKVFGLRGLSAPKLNAALRLRRTMPEVENQVEAANLLDDAVKKLFDRKANPGLFNQKTLPTAVFLVTNGQEATQSPAAWAKRVLSIGTMLRNGTDAKASNGGFVPVWVIGTIDGTPFDPGAWANVRATDEILIDLTLLPEKTTAGKKAKREAYDGLAESISTLMYQLRLVQVTQFAK